MRRCFCFVFLLFMCLMALGVRPRTKARSYCSALSDCTLAAERTRQQPTSLDSYIEQHGYAYPFEKVQSVLAHDDVTVINLENVFYPHQANRVPRRTTSGPTEFARILTEGSVN